MSPFELDAQIRQQELRREAEHFRLVKSLRSEPTFWQRLRDRFAASATPQAETQVMHRDVIASSR